MKFIRHSIVFIALSLLSSTVLADSGFYIGGKTGVLDPESNDYDADADNPVALQAGLSLGNFAIQAEAYSSESEVDNAGTDAELDVVALYGVYRTDGFIYFMAKGGLVDGEITESGASKDDSSISYGLGGGINFADFIFIEAEYIRYDIDDVEVDFLGLSANLKF